MELELELEQTSEIWSGQELVVWTDLESEMELEQTLERELGMR